MAYNDPNQRPGRRNTGDEWSGDRGQHIGGDNNYGIDNDRDYRFREQYWGVQPQAHYPFHPHPVNAAFGTRMGNFGQTVYDPNYGIDSFGYHSDVPARHGNIEDLPYDNHKSEGAHRGRGPKNYVRSDERISEDLNDRLRDDPRVDASDIEVRIDNCEVILSGTVSDREAKRRAADIAEDIRGVRHVENRIRVREQDDNGYRYPGAATTGGSLNLDSKAEPRTKK